MHHGAADCKRGLLVAEHVAVPRQQRLEMLGIGLTCACVKVLYRTDNSNNILTAGIYIPITEFLGALQGAQ